MIPPYTDRCQKLLVMALFLGLRLCVTVEHRMKFSLFPVIYILPWMSNSFRVRIQCT